MGQFGLRERGGGPNLHLNSLGVHDLGHPMGEVAHEYFNLCDAGGQHFKGKRGVLELLGDCDGGEEEGGGLGEG